VLFSSRIAIIPENSSISNFIRELRFPLYLSTPALNHVMEFLYAATQKGYADYGPAKLVEQCNKSRITVIKTSNSGFYYCLYSTYDDERVGAAAV